MAVEGTEVSEETRYNADGSVTITRRIEAFDAIAIPDSVSTARLSQDRGVWSLEYTLESADDARTGKAISVRGATVSEPLATHPLFKNVTDAEWERYRRWEDDPDDPSLSGWQPLTSGSAALQTYHQKRLRGITDYFRPSVTLRVSETGRNGVDLSGLGKIKSPGVSLSVPGSGNWLLTDVEADDRGDGQDFTVSREYLASGAGGWDPDLYK